MRRKVPHTIYNKSLILNKLAFQHTFFKTNINMIYFLIHQRKLSFPCSLRVATTGQHSFQGQFLFCHIYDYTNIFVYFIFLYIFSISCIIFNDHQNPPKNNNFHQSTESLPFLFGPIRIFLGEFNIICTCWSFTVASC